MISQRLLRVSDFLDRQAHPQLFVDYSLGQRRKANLASRGLFQAVGTISAVDSLQTTHGVSGTLRRANVVTGGNDYSFDISRTVQYPWTFGTGAGAINQVVEVIFTATKNTTTTLTCTAALTNRVGDLLATFTKIKELKIEYLTTAQDATNGNASTGTITISPGASNPIVTSPLGADQTFVLNPGAILHWIDPLNGFTVTAGSADTFDLLHSDNVLDAKLRILMLGEK